MPIFNLRQCQVVEVIDEASGIRTLKCRPTDGKPFANKPGQFVMLYTLDAVEKPTDGRAYSMSSSPSEPFAVTYKLAGSFTHKLQGVKEGDVLGFTGPFGFFVLNEGAKHAVMLAGGIGITPFVAYARHVQEKKLPVKLTLLYSNKTVSDISFKKQLDELTASKALEVVYTVTRPEAGTWNGLTKRIDAGLIKEKVADWQEAEYYLCGSPDFVKHMEETLLAMGVLKQKIKEEKF